jgi:hypothetical protein
MIDERELRIVRQSCLKAAVEWRKDDVRCSTDELVGVAERFVKWVVGDAR